MQGSVQITPFSDFAFSSSQPFRMLGQGEDTGRLHIRNKLCWDVNQPDATLARMEKDGTVTVGRGNIYKNDHISL